jgi:DNA polymerase III sliding clamp (beta) subunit (PCNA family)
MKIEKAKLMKALEIVKPGLASKEMIEQSTSFAFMGGRVVTYNDEISISHPVEDMDMTGAVQAEELYQLLGKLKSKEVNLIIKDNEIRLKSGKARAGITLQEEIRLPLEELGDFGDWVEVPGMLMEAMHFCMFSASTDMSRPVLTCVHVSDTGFVESCNNFRLTRYELGEPSPVGDFLIPVGSVKALVKYHITHMASGQGWIHFKSKDDTIFSCRVFEDEYPDVSGLLGVTGHTFTFPETLREVLGKAAIFSKREQFLDETVDVSILPGEMKVRSEDIVGWFEEKVPMEWDRDEVKFAINPTFLMDVLQKKAPCVLSKDRLMFQGKDWTHVVALR